MTDAGRLTSHDRHTDHLSINDRRIIGRHAFRSLYYRSTQLLTRTEKKLLNARVSSHGAQGKIRVDKGERQSLVGGR